MNCRKVVHAELVSISLLMGDVLLAGYQENLGFGSLEDWSSGQRLGRRSSFISGPTKGKSLSLIMESIESYSLMKSFLILWKRLEKFKTNWMVTRLGVDDVSSHTLYKNAWYWNSSFVLLR